MNAAVWYDFARFSDSIPLVLCLLGGIILFLGLSVRSQTYTRNSSYQFDRTILNGVIAPFNLEYFIKSLFVKNT